MKKRFFTGAILASILCAVLFFACSKKDVASTSSNSTSGTQAVALYLTDGPGIFDSVFISIKTVALVVDTCSKSAFYDFDASCAITDTVNFNAAVYNVTALTNGIDTVLASGSVHQGTIKRINIALGAGSYLIKNGVKYPLGMYPGVDSNLVIQLRGNEFQVSANTSSLWLDFSVENSIYVLRNGSFYLRPYIRVFAEQATGTLAGKVLPRDASPVISVYNSADTLYAIPSGNGNFSVRGLAAGTYSVFINPSNGYQDTIITNVAVTPGRNTNIGTITLHK